MEIKRLYDLLPHYIENYKWKKDALSYKVDGEWKKYSAEDYVNYSNLVSFGLLSEGVNKGDKVAIISNNRPEWNFIDMGLLQIGAIPVPIYPTISESDYLYILNHAEVVMVFVEGEELLRKIEHILPKIPTLRAIYTFKNRGRFNFFEQLLEKGRNNQVFEELNRLKEQNKSNDIATIIYTSGTTGNPKGVMLSHANIISNFIGVSDIPPVGSEGKAISFLPLCHVYERMLNYMYQYLGISIYYAESLATIGDNVKEIKPDIITTVPRLLEKIYDKIINSGRKQKWIKKQIFFWAVSVGLNFELGKPERSFFYRLKLLIANKLVFVKWREALGGNIKVIVSGGAALQERLAKVFTAAGIPILEGYGLTETSPVIAVNTFKRGRKLGTVGPLLYDVNVKIGSDNEILCKGPNVMLGYYKEPELTKEVIDEEGWFHTGDTGIMEDGKYLKITGRKKAIFKTSNGKYINPQFIEEKFKESPFIENIVVLGENQKFAAALLVPDFNFLKSWCNIKGINYTTNNEMINDKVIRKRIQKEVDHYNQQLGESEKIKKYELLANEWSIETGELTPTLKLKRNFICSKYAEIIEKMFA
jgi:long-chain acyl-CoA synthetase